MVAAIEIGERGTVTKGSPEQRIRRIEETFHDLAERNNAVEEAFNAVREAYKTAVISVRAPMLDEQGKPTGRFGYAFVPDHPTRAAAARIMFQALGVIKSGSAVAITNNTQNNTVVTPEQRVRELEAIGVPRELMKEACNAVLDYVEKTPDQPKHG